MPSHTINPDLASRGFKLSLTRQGLASTATVILVLALVGNLVATHYDEVTAALVFMLGVTVAGAVGGLSSALIAAAAAFLIFNFFITQPAFSFRLGTERDLAPLFIFNLCAIVTGILAGRLRDRSELAKLGNARLTNLLRLSRALQSAGRVTDITAALASVAEPILNARLTLFRLRPGGAEWLGPANTGRDVEALLATLLASDDGMLVDRPLVAIRLDGSEGTIGVLLLEETGAGPMDLYLLRTFGGSVSVAFERAILSEQNAERRALLKAEELKTALLNSVSHDFRTPLTAISASASSLRIYRDKLDVETFDQFLRQIVDDCERLNRYTSNLLEMSKLEVGDDPASLQTLGVADMIGVAIQRVRSRAGSRHFETAGMDPRIAVSANPALFELVLINVLDNAILYGPDGTRIVLSAEDLGDRCRIGIADEGCGIPEDDLVRVFERFYRVRRSEASPRGSGLGLAIAKGFVEALGGSIEAQTPGVGNGGTKIVIELPIAGAVPAS
ncbi:ATP-binding protein [Sphingomonas sp. T9W2]|uniref:sensor histidine kinase n=1 Tax=Sphingomonas sp. T9W2 TaxID=3143183 RepID=UPI0031F4BFE3